MNLTFAEMYSSARLFGASVHGDDANGVVVIEYRTVVEAAAHAQMWGHHTRFRDPMVRLGGPVIVQYSMRPFPEGS